MPGLSVQLHLVEASTGLEHEVFDTQLVLGDTHGPVSVAQPTFRVAQTGV